MKLNGQLHIRSQTLEGQLQRKGQVLKSSLSIPSGIHTMSYNDLKDKPKIESVELIGDKTFAELGMEPITGEELINMFEEIWR